MTMMMMRMRMSEEVVVVSGGGGGRGKGGVVRVISLRVNVVGNRLKTTEGEVVVDLRMRGGGKGGRLDYEIMEIFR